MFLPGFAFKFKKPKFLGWYKLLKGRTARVVATTGSPPIIARFMFGDYTNEIRLNLLGFAGIKVRMTHLGPAENISPAKCNRWQKKIFRLGRRGS